MVTAVVLSGGASLGAAQVGMLTALNEARVRPAPHLPSVTAKLELHGHAAGPSDLAPRAIR